MPTAIYGQEKRTKQGIFFQRMQNWTKTKFVEQLKFHTVNLIISTEVTLMEEFPLRVKSGEMLRLR